MPALIQGGMLPYYAYALGLGLPFLAMLVASMVADRLADRTGTYPAARRPAGVCQPANNLDARDHQRCLRWFARQLVLVLLFGVTVGDQRGGGSVLLARADFATPAIGFCR